MKSILPKSLPCFFTLCLIAVLSACGKKETTLPALPPAGVSVVTAAAERVNRTIELPGRINSVREAQVRARATGILLKRLFEEGSNVTEGQVLFEIDPAPLQASLNSAKASMAKTEAALKESQATVDDIRNWSRSMPSANRFMTRRWQRLGKMKPNCWRQRRQFRRLN